MPPKYCPRTWPNTGSPGAARANKVRRERSFIASIGPNSPCSRYRGPPCTAWGAPPRGCRREVVLLYQGHRQAARRGVQRDPGPGDPAADHQHVEPLLGHPGQVGGPRLFGERQHQPMVNPAAPVPAPATAEASAEHGGGMYKPNGPTASPGSSFSPSATWRNQILPHRDLEGPTATAAPAPGPARTRTGS